MDYVVAIPSYKRADSQGTLEWLSNMGVDKGRIFIFVQTEEDEQEYSKYKNKAHIIRRDAYGVAGARNNILNHFCDSQNIIMLDDDIRCISSLNGKNLDPIKSIDNFEKEVDYIYRTMEKIGSKLSGIYPVHNAFFMERSISTRVTVNTVHFFAKGFGLRFDETMNAKEDIDLCANILHRGGIITRHNYLAPNVKHRTNKGGCYETWNKTNENEKAVSILCCRYPDIIGKHPKKNNEVRVITKDKKIKLK